MDWYSDVFDLVFPDLDHEAANNVWKAQLAKAEERDNVSKDDAET